MNTKFRGLVVLSALAITATNVLAQSPEPPTVHYRLQPASTYEQGCYGECLCPILQAPMVGTFDLELLPTGGPLDTFAFDNVDFLVPALELQIVGSGFYTRAGEFNELELDLQSGGDPVMHFSSGGLVAEGAEFPEIDIVVSVNQMLSCFDYVLHIVASPDVTPYPALTVDASELEWSAVTGATAYDVVCGDLVLLRDSAGDLTGSTDQCLGSSHPQTTMPYNISLDAGEGLWFLVRADDGSYDSDGPSQSGSRDLEINASPFACP